MTSPGYVMFEVGSTAFAVSVAEVREVLRASDVRLLPTSEHTLAGRPLALVDARGRSLPALDLRSGPDVVADVLLARDPGRAGLVVDRVTAVVRPGELELQEVSSPALPSYAAGVLRPAGGGVPVLLVSLPEVRPAGDAAYDRTDEPALGEPVLDDTFV